MVELKGKIAIITVDDLTRQKLFLGDPVEVLDQEIISHEFVGCRLALRVKSLRRPQVEKWIWRSEVAFIKEKGEC